MTSTVRREGGEIELERRARAPEAIVVDTAGTYFAEVRVEYPVLRSFISSGAGIHRREVSLSRSVPLDQVRIDGHLGPGATVQCAIGPAPTAVQVGIYPGP